MLATKSVQLRFFAERRRHMALASAFLKMMRSLGWFVDWNALRACFLYLMATESSGVQRGTGSDGLGSLRQYNEISEVEKF